MFAVIKAVIKQYIDQAAQLHTSTISPHNYTTLKQSVLFLELQREIKILRNMLESDNFEEQFKKRCALRALDLDSHLGFQCCPDSITNRMYWNIANLLFTPETMAEMLSILLPQVTTHLVVALPDAISPSTQRSDIKAQLKEVHPILKKASLCKSFTGPVDIDELDHYLVIGSELFNANDISCFTLKLHAFFQEQVTTLHAEFAKKIYQYNTQLQILATSISTYKNKGITPRAAIEQLIKHLKVGGTSVTNQIFASSASVQSLKHFFGYFNSLPAPLQLQLRALSLLHHNNSLIKTLGDLIDFDIERGNCTETTASKLEAMLDHHKNNPILNLPPQMSLDDLKKIERQFGPKNPLDTKRDDFSLITLPKELLKVALQGISTQHHEELVMLIMNFPPSLYDLLWEYLVVTTIGFERLSDTIRSGFFTPEQLHALAHAIVKHSHRFSFGTSSLLEWAISTQELIFVKAVMDTHEDKAVVVKTPFNQALPLHYRPITPQICNYFLNYIPTTQRVEVLNSLNAKGMTVLQEHAADDPEVLSTLLNSVPGEQRVSLITAFNRFGDTLLHAIADRPTALRAIFSCLTPEQRLAAIQVKNKSNLSVLHKSKKTECLKLILELYPSKNERCAAILAVDCNQVTVLHTSIDNPESLALALDCIPQPEQLEAIKARNSYGESVLHRAARLNNESLRMILALIPKEQVFGLLEVKTTGNVTLLQCITSNLASVCILLERLPENQRHLVVQQIKPLLSSSRNAPLIQKILKLIPEEFRAPILVSVESSNSKVNNHCVLQHLSTLCENKKEILELLPVKSWEEATKLLGYPSYLALIISIQDSELFEKLLHSYGDESKRVAALNILDDKKRSGISRIVAIPSLLEVVKRFNVLPSFLKNIADFRKLLSCALSNSTSLTMLLETIPLSQRLAVVTSPNDRGESLLHELRYFQQNANITAILQAMPEEARLTALLTRNKSGKTVVHSQCFFDFTHSVLLNLTISQRIPLLLAVDANNKSVFELFAEEANFPDTLKIILVLLQQEVKGKSFSEQLLQLLTLIPETERLRILKTPISGKSVLTTLAHANIEQLHPLTESFVPTFIKIYNLLCERAHATTGTMLFFRSSRSAKAVLGLLEQATSFVDFKAKLINYLEANKTALLTEELLRMLVPGERNAIVMLDKLKQSWNLLAAPTYIM